MMNIINNDESIEGESVPHVTPIDTPIRPKVIPTQYTDDTFAHKLKQLNTLATNYKKHIDQQESIRAEMAVLLNEMERLRPHDMLITSMRMLYKVSP